MVIPGEDMKLATLPEVSIYRNKYEASGKTKEEALERLNDLCKSHGFPEIKPILSELNEQVVRPNHEGSYYCGTIDVQYFFKTKKRYNPVWFTKMKNGMIITSVYL
mgnify:CR=1 FL=1